MTDPEIAVAEESVLLPPEDEPEADLETRLSEAEAVERMIPGPSRNGIEEGPVIGQVWQTPPEN